MVPCWEYPFDPLKSPTMSWFSNSREHEQLTIESQIWKYCLTHTEDHNVVDLDTRATNPQSNCSAPQLLLHVRQETEVQWRGSTVAQTSFHTAILRVKVCTLPMKKPAYSCLKVQPQ